MTNLKKYYKYLEKQKDLSKKYIFNLAFRITEKLTNEDIETCISVLNKEEKELLKRRLLDYKINIKTPEDYEVNRKIYHTIAIILDLAVIKQNRNKNINP